MEYYSSRHDQWVLAVVSLAALHAEPLGRDSFVAVIYNVQIGRGRQHRFDVDLRFLRRPLAPHETVEVRSELSGVWQTAQISKAKFSNLGRSYMVTLDGSAGASLIVPATSVRRRFPDGSSVSVYHGTTDGWVSGVLQNCASSGPVDLATMALPPLPLVRVSRNCVQKKSKSAHTVTTGTSNMDQRDFLVCIAGLVERVPAHLVDYTGKRRSRE